MLYIIQKSYSSYCIQKKLCSYWHFMCGELTLQLVYMYVRIGSTVEIKSEISSKLNTHKDASKIYIDTK